MKIPVGTFLAFVGVVGGIVAAIHAYLWFRLVRTPAWPEPWRGRAAWGLVALGAWILVALVATRPLPRHVATAVGAVGYVWLGAMFYVFLALLVLEPVRLIADSTTSARWMAAGAVGAAAALCVYGGISVACGPYVERLTVPVRGLDPRLVGFRIVQISDLHVRPMLGRGFVEKVVGMTNGESPDVVVVTGDLVDGDVARIGPDVEPLRDLVARHGVLFVTGNHDFYSGADSWAARVGALGVRVLRNERTTLVHDGASIDFAGVEDPTGASVGDGPDFEKALGGRDASRPVVLLAHQPAAVHGAAERGVDLVLAGHTHGGQLWPFGIIESPFHPAVEGLHRFGGTLLYVSRGTGFWGPPMRVFEPAEVTVIELARATN